MVEILEIPENLHHSLNAKVFDFISDDGWSLPTVLCNAAPVLAAEIRKIVLPIFYDAADFMVWSDSDDGKLALKTAFNHLNPCSAINQWSKSQWGPCIPPPKSFLTWRLFYNKMPTNECLRARGCISVSICDLCYSADETTDHLFFRCNFVGSIWSWLANLLNSPIDLSSTVTVFNVVNRNWCSQVKDIIKASIINVVYFIWYCRNQVRFQIIKIPIARAISLITSSTRLLGLHSKGFMSSSLEDFKILKAFNVEAHLNKSPSI